MRHVPLPPSPFTFSFSPFFCPLSTSTQINYCCSNIKNWKVLGSAYNVPIALHFQGRLWQVRVLGAQWKILYPWQDCDILEYLYFSCNTEQKHAEDLLISYVSRSHSGTGTLGSAVLPVQGGGGSGQLLHLAEDRSTSDKTRDPDCQIFLYILLLWCENRLLHTFCGTDFSSICACHVSKEGDRTIIILPISILWVHFLGK